MGEKDKEIKGLPPIKVEVPTERLGAPQERTTLCFDDECGRDKSNKVRAYDLLELFATVDFYKWITQHTDILAMLPDKPERPDFNLVVGPYQINQARKAYFAQKGIRVPEEEHTEAYRTFKEANLENKLFDYLVKEWVILQTCVRAEERPKTAEEFDKRMREVLPERYYLEVSCCDAHQEATIRHAVNATWYRYISHDIEEEGPIEQRVWSNSLIHAPQRRQEPKVILSTVVAKEILPRAQQTRDLFYEIVQKTGQ